VYLLMKRDRTPKRPGVALLSLATVALATVVGSSWSGAHAGAPPNYSIDFYSIGAGGSLMRGSCFHLSGTVGQTAPGYSSDIIYALIAGYWQPQPTASDEIFFNGFEGCST
jgi:hypothetical protein